MLWQLGEGEKAFAKKGDPCFGLDEASYADVFEKELLVDELLHGDDDEEERELTEEQKQEIEIMQDAADIGGSLFGVI